MRDQNKRVFRAKTAGRELLPGLLTFCLVFLSAAGCFSRSRNPIRSVNSSGVNVLTRFLTG